MRQLPNRFDDLLSTANPSTSEGADFLLDLRELLLSRGHAGKCVHCFFGLLGDLGKPGALAPLRHWLEQNLEVAVTIDDEVVEVLPVSLDQSKSLEEFCHRAMDTVRYDRSYDAKRIEMEFRYRDSAPALT